LKNPLNLTELNIAEAQDHFAVIVPLATPTMGVEKPRLIPVSTRPPLRCARGPLRI
jgi:hypothetical protein